MYEFPRRKSPGCALLFISIVLFFLGILILVFSVLSMTVEKQFDLVSNIPLLLLAIVLLLFAWGSLKESLTTDKFQDFLTRDPQEDARPVSREKNVIAEVKEDIRKAPSQEEVINLLTRMEKGRVKTANPKLQLIAFALRPTTPWQYLKGMVLEIFAWVGLVISLPVILLLTVYGIVNPWDTGKFALKKAIKFSRQARRYRIRPHNIFKRDARPPVLYLRAFAEDSEGNEESFLPTTSEERLTSFYNQYGPVIAIGQPKEEIPLLGASRIYFRDLTWQSGIIYLMSISQMVVIHAGIAQGLLWELGVARQKLEPQRLVISFAAWKELDESKRRFRYLQFKEYAERIMSCTFPPEMIASRLLFSSDWIPYFE